MLEDIFLNTSDWIDLGDKDDSITKRCEMREAFCFDKHFVTTGFTNIP
jgi:hypothetical protein